MDNKYIVNTITTVTARTNDTGVRFCDTIFIVTQAGSSSISKTSHGSIQLYNSTARKVRSIFPHLKWHSTNLPQQKKQWEILFMYKLASALPGRSTKMDPMSKTIYKKV